MSESAIKGVILSIDHVILAFGKTYEETFNEVKRLINYLYSTGITPVVLANHNPPRVQFANTDKISKLQDVFGKEIKKNHWFIGEETKYRKPKTKTIEYVLKEMEWEANETLYLGNTETDMQTAVNGNFLFLNATWYGRQTEYGIEVNSPKEVARFIDVFCRRKPKWYYTIDDDGLELYTLAPYSTRREEFGFYSAHARDAAKRNGRHPEFWANYLWSNIYFSGLHKRVNFITCYPRHSAGVDNPVMSHPLGQFSKCFHGIKYLPDLIYRHKTATKSATARAADRDVDHLNQLNTIRLNRLPKMGADSRKYKNCPLKKGKTVLVVDDICTSGNSLEASRNYIKQTGATPIVMSWLKTINRSYRRIDIADKFNPFESNNFAKNPPIQNYDYNNKYIENPLAPEELDGRLKKYLNWDWD